MKRTSVFEASPRTSRLKRAGLTGWQQGKRGVSESGGGCSLLQRHLQVWNSVFPHPCRTRRPATSLQNLDAGQCCLCALVADKEAGGRESAARTKAHG